MPPDVQRYSNFSSPDNSTSQLSPLPSVIIFGETGAGKSSVINMLRGGNEARVSNQAKGATFSSACYEKTIAGSAFMVFDTVGLNEGSAGTVTAQAALEGLYRLVRQLRTGVNLLVYVMRAPRVKETAPQNYDMFFDVFCHQKVPIAIIITGLEGEDNMDGWWDENKKIFDEYKMKFTAHACITATRGRFRDGEYLYDVEYEESKKKVEDLIRGSHNPIPWKMPIHSWFVTAAGKMQSLWARLGFQPSDFAKDLQSALQSFPGLDRDATVDAGQLQDRHGPIPNVIVFGDTGAGKSSIINMLQGGVIAQVSDQARKVTFSNVCYEKTIRESTFRIFDTAGLNEGAVAGTVTVLDGIQRFYQLIRQLTDGVSLLIYVMRGPRIKATAEQNYKLFFEILCNKKVPIVIVITGLEDRDDMDQWWVENKGTFEQQHMLFKDSACVTAKKGKLKDGVHFYETEYEASRKKLENVIVGSCGRPWRMPTRSWFASTAVKVHNILATMLGLEPVALENELYLALKSFGGLSDHDARTEANKISQREFC